MRPVAAAHVVIGLAAGIAALAVLEAVIGLVSRWFSSRIGEGLIVDLRRAVFEARAAMPVAFFTRTRTGALVSRLNNDVIGAQSAITSTLAGCVSNIIQLVLALAVMFTLAWQVTLLALVLLPMFVLPARRMGARSAGCAASPPTSTPAMSTQMTERFSAPGATLVKLFGRPEDEADEFGERGRAGPRHRGADGDGRRGCSSRRCRWCPRWPRRWSTASAGSWRVTGRSSRARSSRSALLLTRLYTPMTALANARVDVMTALVSFERVFEVLDLEPMITERPDPAPCPTGRSRVRLRGVRFALPARRAGVAGLAGGGGGARPARRRGGAARRRAARWRRAAARAGRAVGRGQVDDRHARPAALRRGLRRGRAVGGIDVRDLTFAGLRGAVGVVTQDGHLFHDTIARQPALRRARTPPTPSWSTPCAAPGSASCSTRCPTGWTRWWGSAATGSRAASASA